MNALGNRNVPVCWTRRLAPYEHATREQPVEPHRSIVVVVRRGTHRGWEYVAIDGVGAIRAEIARGIVDAETIYAACEQLDAMIPAWVAAALAA
jgi:hypothetical protein